ncbi:MAG TPA: polynucleotide adenylyltransferase PcnB [Alcaligenes sp.]|nr:polynucleotide adenylyltransferase PcnB [Alcaligenes sp.]HRL27566.1 polynucleotide adenylyltransferase PcnB [Alcaligenes sp.]
MLKQTIKTFVNRLLNPSQRTRSSGPRRYERQEHGIDRRLVSRHAVKVCEVLSQQGYEAYVVGGAVRDLIVGLEPKDFDVATNATPEQIRALFRRARIIGKRFRLVHVVFGQEVIETSTFRADDSGKQTDEHGRILRDNEFGTLKDDAARRDFTLNALYYDPLSETVIDYHNGVADLKERLVRIIGDPETRYREDPVRMLRAVRFAAKLDATIESKTKAPIQPLARLIENVPESRLFDETLKLLSCGHAMDCIRRLQAQGLDSKLLPMVSAVQRLPGGEAFLEMALARTDSRVRAGKSASPSFIYACLLWKLVQKDWQQRCDKGEHPQQALLEAADAVIESQTRIMPIQKRFQSDMREIWFMQPRFERIANRAIWRMTEQPRFRAAVDFMQLRAEAKEVDSVQAQWWMDLANAGDDERSEMIAVRKPASTTATGSRSGQRRNRRRRSNAKRSNAAGASES